MIYFWITAALFIIVALLFILTPLLRRSSSGAQAHKLTVSVYRDQMAELEADLRAGTINQKQYEVGQQELEQRLLDEVPISTQAAHAQTAPYKNKLVLPLAMAITLPVCAVLLYLYLGRPDAMSPESVQDGAQTVTREQMVAMVEKLAARLKEKPDDAKGWQMLARSYKAFGRFPESAEAYKRAMALTPNDAELMADYADTLGAVNGGDLNGEPLALIQAALKLDPNHQKSLALAGTVAFNNKDFSAAVTYWQRLLKTLPSDSEDADLVGKNIAEAQAALKGAPVPAVTQTAASPQTPASAVVATSSTASITGIVSLSPALAAKAAPEDTVFIFARAASGPKMPLAILKVQVKDLPKSFSLDDSTAMAPTMKLSNFPEVMVNARVTKSGNATPQSGDLTGTLGPVKVGTQQVKVLIDAVVP